MRVCLTCDAKFAMGWTCPVCHNRPQQIDGFLAFAPELVHVSSGFKPEYFAELATVEAGNFWFRARNRLITWALRHHFPQARNFFEIGCGTGFVLSGIEREFPQLLLWGSEVYSAGLACAAERIHAATLVQMDARKIPFEKEFDVIGAFDVLEHIEEDLLVLAQMHQALVPGGGILLTVPQHAFLWSQADEDACHVRRYEARALTEKIQQVGFTIIRVTSFVSLLLPFMMISRLRYRRDNPMAELEISGLANTVLERVLDLERCLIRYGLQFPVGGSLLVVARKI
jgi:SAM-dependent methyltransferase